MKKLLILALIVASASMYAFDTTALQFSVWAPRVQLVPPEIAISGIKLNLPYGNNSNITGLDLGLFSINCEQSNDIEAVTSALQINLVNITSGEFSGFQIGLYNQAERTSGIQIGLINNIGGCAHGVSIGLINTAMDFRGLQIGLLNYTEFLTGVQIGLLNIATRSTLPFFPVVNICF